VSVAAVALVAALVAALVDALLVPFDELPLFLFAAFESRPRPRCRCENLAEGGQTPPLVRGRAFQTSCGVSGVQIRFSSESLESARFTQVLVQERRARRERLETYLFEVLLQWLMQFLLMFLLQLSVAKHCCCSSFLGTSSVFLVVLIGCRSLSLRPLGSLESVQLVQVLVEASRSRRVDDRKMSARNLHLQVLAPVAAAVVPVFLAAVDRHETSLLVPGHVVGSFCGRGHPPCDCLVERQYDAWKKMSLARDVPIRVTLI
jgi:hypothetical protein